MPTMPSAEHNEHYAMDIVLQRVQALESRVGQLESQVLGLQGALHTPTAASATSPTLPSQRAVAIPLTWAQKTTAIAPISTELQLQALDAAQLDSGPKETEKAGVDAARKSTNEQQSRHGDPANTPKQQAASEWTEVKYARRPAPAAPSTPVLALAMTRKQVTSGPRQPPSRPLPFRRADPSIIPGVKSTGHPLTIIDVAIKVFGEEGHAQAGLLQPPSPKDWQLRLRLHLDPTGHPTISLAARLSTQGPLPAFLDQMGHEMPFATFRIDFDVRDISEASLELGSVADSLLLPQEIASQLEDPNEVPTSLRYLAFSWRKCRMAGFEKLKTMPALSRDGIALLKTLELLKARPGNAVQMWFWCMVPRRASEATIDCIFRAIGKAKNEMYKSICAIEKTAESALLNMEESGGD